MDRETLVQPFGDRSMQANEDRIAIFRKLELARMKSQGGKKFKLAGEQQQVMSELIRMFFHTQSVNTHGMNCCSLKALFIYSLLKYIPRYKVCSNSKNIH